MAGKAIAMVRVIVDTLTDSPIASLDGDLKCRSLLFGNRRVFVGVKRLVIEFRIAPILPWFLRHQGLGEPNK
jgi:hypothetical protein